MPFSVCWRQLNAGQGGLHVGRAATDSAGGSQKILNWIYDCGAVRRNALDDVIDDYADEHSHEPIDLLFISHFDRDHVSGLDRLLRAKQVTEVVLPHVNDGDLAVAMMEEVLRPGRDYDTARRDWFARFLDDPIGYLRDGGVERIVWVGPSPFSGDGEFRALDSSPFGPDRKFEPGWAVSRFGRLRNTATAPAAESTTEVFTTDGPVEIHAHAPDATMRFLTYRPPLHENPHIRLVKDGILLDTLTRLIGLNWTRSDGPGLNGLAAAIARFARVDADREKLVGIYKRFARGSNRASLSMLSVPVAPSARTAWAWVAPDKKTPRLVYGRAPAWLCTGDAELLKETALCDWANHFGDLLDDVVVALLPHHGSDKNSDADFQARLPGAEWFVATSRGGGRHHPGPLVLEAAGERLIEVTNEISTILRLKYRLPALS
ncbi:hypothetical protein [Brevundimonas sp.]|uniref:hypothetical protein n=1 Tax=Brevundimonas sp. TaxID=1871086 RepID=UPI003565D66E